MYTLCFEHWIDNYGIEHDHIIASLWPCRLMHGIGMDTFMDGTPLGRGTKDENSGCGCGGEEKGGWLPNKHSLQSLLG